MLEQGNRYLSDLAYRRQALLQSLPNHANMYAKQRIGHYALGRRGWDMLPEWNPRSVGVGNAVVAQLGTADVPTQGRLPASTPQLWDGRTPRTMREWVALGRTVFFRYPLRSEVFAEWALRRPETAARVGIEKDASGKYPGIVLFADVDGRSRIGITCALCHTAVHDGRVVEGRARRAFDYGRLRLDYHQDTREPVDADLARRMATWGPGRADVTEDVAEDPVAIPDLWGLRHQTALTQAGTLNHLGPVTLAIRQETQLLHTNHQRVRPPRVLSLALAYYLYALEPPPVARAHPETAAERRGQALFDSHCVRCHSNEAYGGDPIDHARVGTSPELATGTARGTGRYRPSSLLRVADAAPYLHHGAVATLEDLMSPERLAAGFTRSPVGPGPVPGHTFGTELPQADRDALVAYLRTL